ncbi:MAG: hypothetical protein IT440_09610 [Phycisphaeraceae bacterium]|nr:hypothetical protein [Phycisphaeraceae bacterium]
MPLQILLELSLLLTTAVSAQTLRVTQDGPRYVVDNSSYRLTIDASRGGAVRSLVFKDFNPDKEWIYPDGGGLLEDMLWQQPHPGEFQNSPYEARVLENTEKRFVLEMWRASQDEQPAVRGLVLRKVVTLTADSPAIHVTMTLDNPTDEDRFPGAWIQNRFFAGGDKGYQVAMRPSYLGIRRTFIKDDHVVGDDMIRKPTDGWSMSFNPNTGAGMLALVDFNELNRMYNCLPAYTMEWFYDRALVPAHGSRQTRYTLVPVKDVYNCYYADERVLVTVEKADTFTLAFRATEHPVSALPVKVKVETSNRGRTLAEASVTFNDLTREKTQLLPLKVENWRGKPFIVALQAGERKTEFMFSADDTLYFAPESVTTYRAPLPRKQKPQLMAAGESLRLSPHQGWSVLYAAGLWHEFNRVKEAATSLDAGASFRDTYSTCGVLGPDLTYQPLLARELVGYDLVVLDNVGAGALGEMGEIAVSQYVQAGGSLLVCGGLCTLGRGRFHESPLADVLPVEVDGFFDLHALPDFAPLEPEGSLGSVQWIQSVKSVKPGAQVLLRVRDKPALVVGRYGQGHVAVWLGTPMGDPPRDVTPYWDSPRWVAYLAQMLCDMKPAQP